MELLVGWLFQGKAAFPKRNKPSGIKTTSIRLRVFVAPMLREEVARYHGPGARTR
jgi:hypothetical protein